MPSKALSYLGKESIRSLLSRQGDSYQGDCVSRVLRSERHSTSSGRAPGQPIHELVRMGRRQLEADAGLEVRVRFAFFAYGGFGAVAWDDVGFVGEG